MRWNDKDIEILKEKYGKIPIHKLCVVLNRDRKSINKKAMKLKLKGNMSLSKKRYNIDHNYFAQPNHMNSYWAGFIAADGCVSEKENSLRISSSIKDEDHLYEFRNNIQFDGPIQRHYEKRKGKGGIQSILNIHGVEQWKNDLYNNFNITPRKTFTLKSPNLTDDEFILAFIIGYIDGDGSIFLYNKKYTCLSIAGTYHMVKWIKDNLFRIFNLPNKTNIYNNGNIKTISINGKQADFMIKQLKKIVVPKMARKWQRI